MYIQAAPLGFSFTHALKRVGHGVSHAAHSAEHGVVSASKAAAHVAMLPAKEVVHAVNAVMKLAFRPITNRIHTLQNRRAGKIAFDKRKSTTPTPAEHAEAKTWTKNKLKSQGPQGKLLALFAGPPPAMPLWPTAGMLGQDPATVSIIAASIPVFKELMNKILGKAAASGEAPAKPGDAPADSDPAADAAATQQAASGGGDAAAAGGDGSDGTDAGSGGDGTGKGKGKGDGAGALAKRLGVSKKQLMIGGAVVGGLVLLVLLMPSKKS